MKRMAICLMIVILLVTFSYGCVKRAPDSEIPSTIEETK